MPPLEGFKMIGVKKMKKILAFTLCLGIMVLLAIGATTVSAEKITVELDGEKIEFDVSPEIIGGSTMVPLRKIFEALGATVKWNDETKTVSARKNSKTVTLTVDSSDLQIESGKTDGEGNPVTETVTLDAPAQIISGRTLVPVRAVSESFGLNVEWNEKNRKVIITSDEDDDDSWKENVGSINLTEMTYEGEGVSINDNSIEITEGGDFTVTGTLDGGSIVISSDEKVKLRLAGVNITTKEGPCIFVKKADKAYITLTEGTKNYLSAENSEDGAVYSKENLEIKGNGELEIKSAAGHGIKSSDNLNIENGTLKINAAADGIHVNDTFKMTDGTVEITAAGDGIDCESIVDISGGSLNIETVGTPMNGTSSEENTSDEAFRGGMFKGNDDVEFEQSTKGISADWMMTVSGGKININSASHALHCKDEIGY